MDENQSATQIPEPPHRRFRLTLDIEADSLQAMRESANRAMYRLNQGTEEWDETRDTADGSLEIVHDPKAPMGLNYATAMREWQAKIERSVSREAAAANAAAAAPAKPAALKKPKAAPETPTLPIEAARSEPA